MAIKALKVILFSEQAQPISFSLLPQFPKHRGNCHFPKGLPGPTLTAGARHDDVSASIRDL